MSLCCNQPTKKVLRVDPSSVDVDAPVPSLGLGSMEGVMVLSLLKVKGGLREFTLLCVSERCVYSCT